MKRLGDNQNHHNRFLTAITGWWRQADVGTDLNRIFVLILLALGTGFIFNTVFLWSKQPAAPTDEPPANFDEITVEHAYQLAQKQQAVIVDARAEKSYSDKHIAGAMSLPSAYFDRYYPDFAIEVSNDQTVIVYCAAGCGTKEAVGRKLWEKGYQHIAVMNADPDGWAAAGYPVATGDSGGGEE